MLRRVVVGTLILLGASCINVAGDNLSFQNSSTEQAAYSTRNLLGASGKCDNEDGYFFKGNEKKGCDWVAKNAKKRCKKKDKKRNKKKVKVFCPSVCKKSCATKPLTKPPTQSPTDACACNDDGDGPFAKVPASGTDGQFQAIVDNYLDGDTSADSSRKLYGDKIACWDVDSVTNMYRAFFYKEIFNEPIGCWNTESVTNMEIMFSYATAFNQYIGEWDVASVTDMSGMFEYATAFNQNIGEWDVASVNDMSFMFGGAIAFNQDIGEWVVALVTGMNYMFYGATVFNQDISEWVVSSVTTMTKMFSFADAFNQNLCSWDIQVAGFYTYDMFYNSNCPNNDDPTASAVCQSCDRRHLVTTDIAIDAASKPNKPANNNNIKKN